MYFLSFILLYFTKTVTGVLKRNDSINTLKHNKKKGGGNLSLGTD